MTSAETDPKMRNASLIHDAAFHAAHSVLEVFSPVLRDDEKRDAFQEVYERVKAAVEWYELRAGRREERLNPSPN
jgi:hypothetical protein